MLDRGDMSQDARYVVGCMRARVATIVSLLPCTIVMLAKRQLLHAPGTGAATHIEHACIPRLSQGFGSVATAVTALANQQHIAVLGDVTQSLPHLTQGDVTGTTRMATPRLPRFAHIDQDRDILFVGAAQALPGILHRNRGDAAARATKKPIHVARLLVCRMRFAHLRPWWGWMQRTPLILLYSYITL